MRQDVRGAHLHTRPFISISRGKTLSSHEVFHYLDHFGFFFPIFSDLFFILVLF